jgi:hypothetical protein
MLRQCTSIVYICVFVEEKKKIQSKKQTNQKEKITKNIKKKTKAKQQKLNKTNNKTKQKREYPAIWFKA